MKIFLNDSQLPELKDIKPGNRELLLSAAYGYLRRAKPLIPWIPTILGLSGCAIGAALLIASIKALLPAVYEASPLSEMSTSAYLSVMGGAVGGSALSLVGKQVVRSNLRKYLRMLTEA